MANKLGTFCAECDFFEDGQCLNGRLDAFSKAGTSIINTENGPVIPRVCNMFRKIGYRDDNVDWPDQLKKEIAVGGTVIVLADNANALEYTLDRLSRCSGISKFNVVIVHLSDLDSRVVRSLCEVKLNAVSIDYRCVLHLGNSSKYDMMDEAFKLAKNGFTIWLESGKPFDMSIMDKLNKLVNEKMIPVLMIEEQKDQIHSMVSFAIIYNFLYGNRGNPFSEKMRDKSVYETGHDKDSIFTWDEVNEIIS